ncbi:MAG: DUF3006 domain-containing protein [Clostridia bacterium]|nr:DUF3006 domain-containing protein [Clostridia bacterium]
MKKLQVDRFEGEIAVLYDENKRIYDVPKDLFGFTLHEGDILEVKFEEDKPVSARFLEEETETMRNRIKALKAKLKRK